MNFIKLIPKLQRRLRLNFTSDDCVILKGFLDKVIVYLVCDFPLKCFFFQACQLQLKPLFFPHYFQIGTGADLAYNLRLVCIQYVVYITVIYSMFIKCSSWNQIRSQQFSFTCSCIQMRLSLGKEIFYFPSKATRSQANEEELTEGSFYLRESCFFLTVVLE